MNFLKNLVRGRVGGNRLTDLLLSLYGNPRLFVRAFRNAASRRSQLVESGVVLSERKGREPVDQLKPAGLDTLIHELSEMCGVLQISKTDNTAAIGVSAANFLSAIYFVKSRQPDAEIEEKDSLVPFESKDFNRRALLKTNVKLCWIDEGRQHMQLSLEPYYEQADGTWFSNNNKNRVLRKVRNDVFSKPSLTCAEDVLGAPTLASQSQTRCIDAVYTWVNHNDAEWGKMYAEAMGASQNASKDATSVTRFHNNDELKYSLRSLRENAPWINKIYVLTNCARPDWLKDDSGDIVWVDHAQVLPQSVLPTFNSHVIESALHMIDGLSEHFIYLNDDVFLGRPITRSFFYDANGTSKSFLEGYGMVSGAVKVGDPDYLNAARNSAKLLLAEFGVVPTQLHRHTPFALRRSVLAQIEEKWPAEFEALRQNKFRTENDINVVSFLYHHYAIMSGVAREVDVKCTMVKTMDIHWKAKLIDVSLNGCDTFCINEGGELDPAFDWHTTVSEFLFKRFPVAAPWEN